MYAIDEGLQKINGEMVETFHREVIAGNTDLEVEAGTTGYKGGCCRNAGGRTYLSLLCLSGDFFFGPIKDDDGNIAKPPLCAIRRRDIHWTIITRVPSSTIAARRTAFQFARRKQPCDSALPTDSGFGVPWMP